MKAIIPLNITALRVSPTDASNIVTSFKGRTANFDNTPYQSVHEGSSTGDNAIQSLESDNSPLATLKTGIHLHWELPDYFKKGVQSQATGEVMFPQVPNRWLVTRYLSKYDERSGKWLEATNHSWIIESDYISRSQLKDSDGVIRPSIPVPLPVNPNTGEQPFRYMGRVVDASVWPVNHPDDEYLSSYNSADGKPLYLHALGFLGPTFSTYYPDCCSVFGFCDRFLDDEPIYNALQNGDPIQFKACYHVMGWIDGDDPLDEVTTIITDRYNHYTQQCKELGEVVSKTPADFFTEYATNQFQWLFSKSSVSYTLDKAYKITSLTLPQKTMCSGLMQEVVWNMLESPGSLSFLGNPDCPTEPAIWKDEDIRIALGNSSPEALAALLKCDISEREPTVKNEYENLLNLLQSGKLDELETRHNILSTLEQAAHTDGFAREQGGLSWIIRRKSESERPDDPTQEVNLPLPLAEYLSLLNQSQKVYDMGRHALSVIRKQLYMDWYRYIKMYTAKEKDVDFLNQLIKFLDKKSGFTRYVIDQGDQTGILTYYSSNGGKDINGIKKPDGSQQSKAYQVWKIFSDLQQKIASFPDWEMMAMPAPCFWVPTDPVSAIEAKSLDCRRRNGSAETIRVRTSAEMVSILTFRSGKFCDSIHANEFGNCPDINSHIPCAKDCEVLSREAAMLIPSLAPEIADVLRSKGGEDNPAVLDRVKFIISLMYLQGGVSSLEFKDSESGIFEKIRSIGYVAEYNINGSISAPIAMDVTFTNENALGMICDYVGWNTQKQLPQLDHRRYDPFLPLSIVWDLRLEQLKHMNSRHNYSPANITNFFSFNEEGTDFTYSPDKPFTEKETVVYEGSAILIKKSVYGITKKIEKYVSEHPDDPDNVLMHSKIQDFEERRIITQTLTGFNAGASLRYYIPQMDVKNLTTGKKDTVTLAIHSVAVDANQSDNWYDDRFNSDAPISKGELALNNFGPLRSGFLSVTGLETVDIFGQRMQLSTPKLNQDGSLQVAPSVYLSPSPQDTAHANKAFLPARLLPASRLFFRWLSATWSGSVKGVDAEFVEMNLHPTTSPVCGWILPNNLDNSLFFYDSDGNAIGSFGIEHGDLMYRTKAGNIENPSDDLSIDIGTPGHPIVNKRLADFMWYMVRKSGAKPHNGGFLSDLMKVILKSDQFISPKNTPRDGSLAVLTGRPLALLRCVLSAETAGGVLPLNQAHMQASDPWSQDIIHSRFHYNERMKHGAAALDSVGFPVRLGDTYNMDDGLIGYIRESKGDASYGMNDFYAPAASASGKNGVIAPSDTDILLTLNAPVETFTLLMDPRAAVHATTAVMPVESLILPSDQYTEAVGKLQMTFFTHPLLQQKNRFSVPISQQSGYVWSWVAHRMEPESSLLPMDISYATTWGYSPQTIEEGWLKLSVDPDPAPNAKEGEG